MLTATSAIWRQNGGTREDGGQEWLELWPTDVEDFFVWEITPTIDNNITRVMVSCGRNTTDYEFEYLFEWSAKT